VFEALRRGQLSAIMPVARDLEVAGQRLSFSGNRDCKPSPAPAPKPDRPAPPPSELGPAFNRP